MFLIPGHPPGNHLSALFLLLSLPPPPPPQQELLRSLITLTTADAARLSLLEGQVQGLGLGARPTWEDLNKSRFSKTLKLGGGWGNCEGVEPCVCVWREGEQRQMDTGNTEAALICGMMINRSNPPSPPEESAL